MKSFVLTQRVSSYKCHLVNQRLILLTLELFLDDFSFSEIPLKRKTLVKLNQKSDDFLRTETSRLYQPNLITTSCELASLVALHYYTAT